MLGGSWFVVHRLKELVKALAGANLIVLSGEGIEEVKDRARVGWAATQEKNFR